MQTDIGMSRPRQIYRPDCPHGKDPRACDICVKQESKPPTHVIDVESLSAAPVAPDSKRMRLQTQPPDIARLVKEIEDVYAKGEKSGGAGGVHKQMPAGGAAGAAAEHDKETEWLRLMHETFDDDDKPKFIGEPKPRDESHTELPVCQPQAAYVPPGEHDSEAFVGTHENLHRPYKDGPIQTMWKVVQPRKR